MNESRIFLCNGNYKLFSTTGVLTTKTADEVQLFCQQNRGVTIVFFQQGTESAPAFFTQSDARVKTINLTTNTLDELTASYDRELVNCFDLVAGWLISLCPALINLKYLLNQVSLKKSIK